MFFDYNIAIIGFGEVGTSTAMLLNAQFKNVIFNIIDPLESISGRFQDFSHACASQNNEIVLNDFESLNFADFVIYSAGVCNSPGESRSSVAKQNKEIVSSVFQGVSLKPSALVLVVTNPVELVSRWIYEELNHSNLVIGTGTLLDTFRLNSILSNYENVHISEISSLVLGEHGKHMTIIASQSKVCKKAMRDIYSEKELSKFYTEIQNSASQIRETEKATKFGVAACVGKIISHYLKDKVIKIPLSVLINKQFKELLLTEEDIYLSLLCEIGNENISIVNEQNNSDEELMQLRDAAKSLEEQNYKTESA